MSSPSSIKPFFKPNLSTARLFLQLHSKSNITQTDHIVACLNDPVNIAQGDTAIRSSEECIALGRIVGLSPYVRGPHNEEGPCNYIMHLRSPKSDREGAHKDTPDGPMIGMINLLQPQVDTPPQIGWVTLHEYSGKGYATEAAREALWYWREEFGLKEIVAVINAKNSASIRIARKLGFEVRGRVDGQEREVWVLKGMREMEQQEVERLLG